jgi:hypothetical protein
MTVTDRETKTVTRSNRVKTKTALLKKGYVSAQPEEMKKSGGE